MLRKYIYKDSEYTSVNKLRQAIWATEFKAFGKEPTENIEEFWKELGVQFIEYTPEVVEPSLDILKNNKLNEVEYKFNNYRNSKNSSLVSSLGFAINCNNVAYTNIDGLISQLEMDPTMEVVQFMDFDDHIQELVMHDLKILKNEISKNGSSLYQQKWMYKDAIEKCTSKEELDEIKITYTSLDFSK